MTTRRILRTWNSLPPRYRERGAVWYREAHEQAQKIARESDTPIEVVCGVIARLSPGLRWPQNIRDARALCVTGDAPLYGGYGPNLARAKRLLAGEPWRTVCGYKIEAFRDNILRPTVSRAVTIDRHILAWASPPWTNITRSRYQRLAHPWMLAAQREQVLPHQLQAAIWLYIRHKGKDDK